ncbi:MAG TPA: acyl-CoA dehydrogenase family protein, partial [Blastocatellia bacterium]
MFWGTAPRLPVWPPAHRLGAKAGSRKPVPIAAFTLSVLTLEHPRYMKFDLPPCNQDLVERVEKLAIEKFAERAAFYDRTASFPHEDFQDLFEAGLNAPAVPKEY